MRHGFANMQSELIKNYKVSNNTVIITYLDGSVCEIPFSEDFETDLLNRMLEQAQKRNEMVSVDDLKEKRRQALFWLATQLSFGTLSVSNVVVSDSERMSLISGLLGGIIALTAVVHGASYKFYNDEIKELEKYAIYLSIRERLENIDVPQVFDGVKNPELPLNINTIDNYSLNDIRKIRDNLIGIEQSALGLETTGSKQVLSRKLSK